MVELIILRFFFRIFTSLVGNHAVLGTGPDLACWLMGFFFLRSLAKSNWQLRFQIETRKTALSPIFFMSTSSSLSLATICNRDPPLPRVSPC